MAYKQENQQAQVERKISMPNSVAIHKEAVPFKYLGAIANTIRGGITSRHYKFRFYGDVLLVDYRDVPGIIAEPFMEKVKEK